MGLACAWSIGLRGVDGEVVEIEADLGHGLPGISLVGLPDAALAESRDRVRAAVVNSGEKWPARRITLALSPATLPKQGSGYDVALACCVLAAAGELPVRALRGVVLVGELALDGRVRAVRGVLPALLAARRAGVRRAVVPASAAVEAAMVDGVEVLGARSLDDVLAWLRGDRSRLAPVAGVSPPLDAPSASEDLADVVGQDTARRAVEIAAAGGHHLLMMGPPGSGKTMLARRMVGLLPELDTEAALELAAVRSLAGATDSAGTILGVPPFVAPHHSLSPAALVGGGSGLARPGAVSMAHRGLLFLDEVLEFGPHVLELLRTPLEEGEVRLARKDGVVRYPARFQAVMAANPCPCAQPRDADCLCESAVRRRYRSRLSGPLLDRVDLRVPLEPVSVLTWAGQDEDALGAPESTATVRHRVLAAREAARERWGAAGWRTNAEVPGPEMRRRVRLPREARLLLDHELNSGALTARGVDRCLRVAWTVSDLRGADAPDADDVVVALRFKREAA